MNGADACGRGGRGLMSDGSTSRHFLCLTGFSTGACQYDLMPFSGRSATPLLRYQNAPTAWSTGRTATTTISSPWPRLSDSGMHSDELYPLSAVLSFSASDLRLAQRHSDEGI